jgi:hypothetical protein
MRTAWQQYSSPAFPAATRAIADELAQAEPWSQHKPVASAQSIAAQVKEYFFQRGFCDAGGVDNGMTSHPAY